ncbi:MAG: energy-coupling factor transporter ATPase [Oscillospiraceae bacterium]|nr:energy-coupling factor transporter ATPase [Oscillospiraceae bacterium]
MNSIISLKNVSFSYRPDSPLVLDDITSDIYEGEFVAVLGYNGSGKSTMAKLMNGILLPTAGEVLVNGINTKNEENLLQIRKNVGMVFQNPDNQIVATIVEEDIAFAPENLGLPQEEIEKRVTDAIEAVGLNKHRFDAPYKLSGGQKQRVAIAGVLAMEPRCIVLDEPTAMLDPVGRQLVMNVVKRINKEKGITIVLITHFMEEAALADRVIVLSDGKISLTGTPHDVFGNYDKMIELGLDVPVSTRLAIALQNRGFPIDSNVITPDEIITSLMDSLEVVR